MAIPTHHRRFVDQLSALPGIRGKQCEGGCPHCHQIQTLARGDWQQMVTEIIEATVERALKTTLTAPRFLRSQAAAEYLDVAPLTLEKWRGCGQGPPFTRIGRFIRYDRHDLDTFMTRYRCTGAT